MKLLKHVKVLENGSLTEKDVLFDEKQILSIENRSTVPRQRSLMEKVMLFCLV